MKNVNLAALKQQKQMTTASLTAIVVKAVAAAKITITTTS